MPETDMPDVAINDIQSAMRSCKTIPSRLEALFDTLGISGYIRGDSPPDNVNRLAVRLCARPDKMINFLNNLKETESTDYGETYSPEFIELLSMWAKFPKAEEIQKEYNNWLKRLAEKMIKKDEKIYINKLIIKGMGVGKESKNDKTLQCECKDYVLYIGIMLLDEGGYCYCSMQACDPERSDINDKAPEMKHIPIDTLERDLSKLIRDYLKGQRYPSRVEFVIPLNLIYKINPERWSPFEGEVLGYYSCITFKEYGTLRLGTTDQTERHRIRQSFKEKRRVKWLPRFTSKTKLDLKSDYESNFVILHTRADDFDALRSCVEKYPYMMLTRGNYVSQKGRGYKLLSDTLRIVEKDVPEQLQKLRRQYYKDKHDRDVAHSIVLLWDDGENNEFLLKFVAVRPLYDYIASS